MSPAFQDYLKYVVDIVSSVWHDYNLHFLPDILVELNKDMDVIDSLALDSLKRKWRHA